MPAEGYRGHTVGAEPRRRPPPRPAPPTTEDGIPVTTVDLSQVIPPSSVFTGQASVTTAGLRVQLPDVPCRSASIRARPANTGNVFLGDELVNSATGYILRPADIIDLAIDNLRRLYIDAAVNGEGIAWLVVR